MLQSGLNESWWADSMECYTYLRNVQDILSDGKTPYERRFGKPFTGPINPFGSLVEYHPISAKDQSRIHRFGKKVLPGLFLGYALYAGGFWKGGRTRRRPWRVGDDGRIGNLLEKTQYERGDISQRKREFIFPIADGRIKTLGGDQDLRTSTLVRHRPIQGESNIDFLGESEGSLPTPQDSFPDAAEAINDFWSMSGNFVYRHHVEPRVNLTRREKNHSLFHWNKFTHPELRERIWMVCKNAAPMTIGISMDQEICLILGQVSLSLLY